VQVLARALVLVQEPEQVLVLARASVQVLASV
jgi:hypothetical protein